MTQRSDKTAARIRTAVEAAQRRGLIEGAVKAWMVRGGRGLAPYWGIAFTRKQLLADLDKFAVNDRPPPHYRVVRVAVIQEEP